MQAIDRRTLLKLATCAAVPTSTAEAARSRVPVPKRLMAFCIDFNWLGGQLAPPGHWADASPEQHVDWHAAAGVNTIQTFCISCNGYAWYRTPLVAPQPGLKHDFLKEVVALAHKRGMVVAGYFCVGINPKWGTEHASLSYDLGSGYHIPFTDAYLAYMGKVIEDSIRRTGIDAFMIDSVWNPQEDMRKNGWIAAEQRLFTQLTGKAFPASGAPNAADVLAYERASIDRCWRAIRRARDRASPRCAIWLACARLADPTVAGSRMLRECDWIMNEAPNRSS